jgi:NAD(P)-dependent dehydrogenase (short-subunit alcohol dehydrogenase family)
MAQPLILVTGSTDGIGKAAATALALGGAEVILHGRDGKKAGLVHRQIEDLSGKTLPDPVVADYSRPAEIRQMAAAIRSRYRKLDVLINDAGTYQKTRHVTPDGIELTFAVNYLGPFLLTHHLLPLIRKSRSGRIVNIASSAHFDVDAVHWDNLPAQPVYDAWGAYALSKFADVTFTYSLARSLGGSGITANCLHPGVVTTKLSRSAAPGMATITPEEGARTPVWLATSPDVARISGRYFEEMKAVRSSALSYDRTVQDRLWNMAEDLTGITGYFPA